MRRTRRGRLSPHDAIYWGGGDDRERPRMARIATPEPSWLRNSWAAWVAQVMQTATPLRTYAREGR